MSLMFLMISIMGIAQKPGPPQSQEMTINGPTKKAAESR